MLRPVNHLAVVILVGAALGFGASLVAQGTPTPQGQGPPGGQRQGQPPGGGRRGAGGGRQGPQRDVAVAVGTGVITGKVVAADTGRALKRARVIVSGAGRPQGATTDEQGRYRIAGLAAGAYTISATRTGFVDGTFGQRRALTPGTPVELLDGQQLGGIDLKLSRGGVVTGRVLDEDGEPLARAMVTVLRQQYVRGERQLMPGGADQSDDRGQFRIFGLPPGDYFVSASAGGLDQIRPFIGPQGRVDQPAESSGYAATYYPGVITTAEATRVRLAASQELTGLDFQLQIVPLATVKGVVAGGTGMVELRPDAGGIGRGGGPGGGMRGGIRQDGSFSIPNVTPGKYTIIARTDGGPNGGARTAMQPLVVTGEEVNVALVPAPGVVLSGTMTLEASGQTAPRTFTGFRVNASPIGSAASTPRMGRPTETDAGQFTLTDVMAGQYVLRASAPTGWMMKAVYVDGQDVTDQPIEVKGDAISGINVIFTDKIAAMIGTVRDARGAGAAGITVIAFPTDEKLWLPQSRHILTARTNPSGGYTLASMPPGDYLVVAVDDVEPGEWFDPAFLDQMKERATRAKVEESDQKTLDLKGPA
ncbi:MAG: carboxypeptidase-like regulatory domain-containing protein [Acidobacteriota bacterium]